MKTLYLDCAMGAAGDMLTAALLELLPAPDEFVRKLNGLGIPGVTFTAEPSVKCGIAGTRMRVRIHGSEEGEAPPEAHGHRGPDEIREIVNRLPIPAMVKLDILAVYHDLAEAERHVHGVPVDQIHFHEVGAMDAIADITAVCLLLHELDVDQVAASPVHVGSGSVRCAHGVLPVPAPATAWLLRGVPVYGGSIQGELCTPTGAALLTHFVTAFGEMPVMKVNAIGYGMGGKDFEQANCVRAMLGNTMDQADTVLELRCNLDDMTGEAIGFAAGQLLDAGALDVFTVPIGMKKSRPGVLLTCLCSLEDRARMEELMLRHTTTLGVRTVIAQRRIQSRRFETLQTPYGPVRVKRAGDKAKPEYEDLAQIARSQNLTLSQVRELFTHAK